MKLTLVWPNKYFTPCTNCVLAILEYTVHVQMQQCLQASDEQ